MDKLLRNLIELLETRVKIITTEIQDRVRSFVSRLLVLVFVMFFMVMFLGSLTFGLAIYLNYLLESHTAGFFIMAGVYVLAIIAVIAGHNSRLLFKIFALVIAFLLRPDLGRKPTPTKKPENINKNE